MSERNFAENNANNANNVNNADSANDHNPQMHQTDQISQLQNKKRHIKLLPTFLVILFSLSIGYRYLVEVLTANEIQYKIIIFYSLYPLLFLFFALWLIYLKDFNIKEVFFKKPVKPVKGHRWFWIVVLIFLICSFSAIYYLFAIKYIYFNSDYTIYILPLFIHTVFLAPIVEELIFRGYLTEIGSQLWGNRRVEFAIYLSNNSNDTSDKSDKISDKTTVDVPNNENKTTLPRYIQKYAIPYPALFSSIIFGLWHLNPMQSMMGFFGGLIFCKAKNDWGGSLIAPLTLHIFWNLLFFLIQVHVFPFIGVWLVMLADLIFRNLW